MTTTLGYRRCVLWQGACRAMLPALMLCATGSTGCEHRISLRQFLAMQEEEQEEATAAATQPAATQPAIVAMIDRELGPYRVGPGDVLTVTLSVLDQMSPVPPMQVRVNRAGNIELPTVGVIPVMDLELEDVEQAILKAFDPAVYRNAAAHVSLTEAYTTRVLVLGAVQTPGLLALRRTERNLLYAIAGAGGVTEVASGSVTLKRLRRPADEVSLDLTDPAGIRAALALRPLEEGDIVSVNAKPSLVFVGGLVNAPHPQVLAPGVEMTVLQAIAGSGGLRTDVTPREATLIRRLKDGRDVHVKLDLDRLTTGRDPNITLAAGDVLWVPDTLETRIQDWINKNFFLRAGASANVNYNVSGIEFLNRHSQQSRGTGRRGLEDSFDPFGFLQRGSLLRTLPVGGQ